MGLVDYSSSDEDENNKPAATVKDSTPFLKRKRDEQSSNDLPPLPSKFHDLYASTTRVSTRDDPSLHGGRKRVTPHIEGNWPTHLYIEWYPSITEHESLSKLISTLKDRSPVRDDASQIHTFLTSDLGAPLPLHISLSRPIGFATEQKDDFVASLERAIQSSGIRPFNVTFSALDWVANFENTRWFLVLRLRKTDCNSLNKLLHVCNIAVEEYGQPPLYNQPATTSKQRNPMKTEGTKKTLNAKRTSKSTASKPEWTDLQDVSNAFHISIAWSLKAPAEYLINSTKSIVGGHSNDVTKTLINVDEIKAKVGNIVTSMALPKNIVEVKGLFGF